MREKLIALLTEKFAGVRKDGIAQLARSMALQATTDDEAKTLVDKLTKAQVDEFIKDFRADVDKEVSESNKSFETNLKKKFDFVDKKNTEPGGEEKKTNPSGTDDISMLIKEAVAEAVKPFQTELANYKLNDVANARLQQLNEKLNDCKDETFKAKVLKDFGRMKFDSDEDFSEYLTDTGNDIATANQNIADSALAGQGRPLFTQKGDDGVSSGVAQYLDSQKQEGNVLAGKEL